MIKSFKKQREEDNFNILEEERHHWCEVEKAYGQIEEVKSCASATKIEKRISWASSQSRMMQQERKSETKRKFLNKNGMVH